MGKKGKKKSSKKSKSSKSTDLKNDPNICLAAGDFTLPNGDRYSGEYCAHRLGLIWRQGHGIYTTHDGHVYEGDWADDKLIDNSELVVRYPSGAEFHGRLTKNKYNGPGVYTCSNKLDISCQFSNNQPQGDIALIDCKGKLWKGEAKKDQAILTPENIFYQILPEDRGKGISRSKEFEIASSLNDEEVGEEEDYTEEYWRNLIFAKSTKTDADIDFTNSKWYRRYNKFKKTKAEIKSKTANGIALEDYEREWLSRFKKYKDYLRKTEADKDLSRKNSSEAAFDLIRKFKSPEFAESCPAVKMKRIRRQSEQRSSSSSESDSSDDTIDLPRSKFDKARLRSKVLVKKTDTADRQNGHNLGDILPTEVREKAAKLIDEMDELFLRYTDVDPRCFVKTQLVQFDSASRPQINNVLVCPFKPRDAKVLRNVNVRSLHFTKERKQLALQMRVKKILERKQADEEQVLLFSQAKQIVGEMEALRKSEEDSEGDAQLEPSKTVLSTTAIDELKTQDAIVKSSKTCGISAPEIVEDQETRISRYINERLEQWQNEDEAKKKARTDVESTPELLHMHSVGVDTDSIPDIPKDLLVRMT